MKSFIYFLISLFFMRSGFSNFVFQVSVFRHSGVPAFRRSAVPAFRRSGVPFLVQASSEAHPPALQLVHLICLTSDLFLNQGSVSLLIVRCYVVVVFSFKSMVLSTLINTQNKLSPIIDLHCTA